MHLNIDLCFLLTSWGNGSRLTSKGIMLSMCLIITNTQGGRVHCRSPPPPWLWMYFKGLIDKMCEIAEKVFACVYIFWEPSGIGKRKYFPLRLVQNGLSAPKTILFIVFKFSQAAHILRKKWYFWAMVVFIGKVRVSNSLLGTHSESHRSEPPTHMLFGLIA